MQDHAQKRPPTPKKENGPDILSGPHGWFDGQTDLDPERLLFTDEPEDGEARSEPPPTWPVATAERPGTAGLRSDGLIAPFVLDGPINREAFEVYGEQVLVPGLLAGDVVIMDDLSSHCRPTPPPKPRSEKEPSGIQRAALPVARWRVVVFSPFCAGFTQAGVRRRAPY